MSEKTRKFREFCASFFVEISKLSEQSLLFWFLFPIAFALFFVGNTLWGWTGILFCFIIIIAAMSFLYYLNLLPKKDQFAAGEEIPISAPFSNQNLQLIQSQSSMSRLNSPTPLTPLQNRIQNSRPQVTIRNSTNFQDRHSPRPTVTIRGGGGIENRELSGSSLGFEVRTSINRNREDDEDDLELECGEDSSTIAERLGGQRNQKPLSPGEWSTITSPGFPTRVVRQARGNSPLLDLNFKALNLSPFQMSPNGHLKVGEIPHGSKWRLTRRSPPNFRFPGESQLFPTVTAKDVSFSRHRDQRETGAGTVYLKIAPLEGMSPSAGKGEESELDISMENGKTGLGGISQVGLMSRYNRLSSSANTSLEKALRRGSSPSTSPYNIAEVLANRKGKRNRGHDSISEQSMNSSLKPIVTSSLNNMSMTGMDDNPKDSKRLKFLMPNEANMQSRNLSMLPLTSHNNPENVNMTSESILEQMNQTEKRFLPDDDTPPSIRPLPKKARIPHGSSSITTNTNSGIPVSSSYNRKRRASTSTFSMIEDESRGKAPRFCNCTECYEEAAGVSTLIPSQASKHEACSTKKIIKAATCDRSTETDFISSRADTKFRSHLPIPVSKTGYDADKKNRNDRLQKMLDISFKTKSTPVNSSNSGFAFPNSVTAASTSFGSSLNNFAPPVNTSASQPSLNFISVTSAGSDTGDSKSGSTSNPITSSPGISNSGNGNTTNSLQSGSANPILLPGGDSGTFASSSLSGFGSVAQSTSSATTSTPTFVTSNASLDTGKTAQGVGTGTFTFGSSDSTKPRTDPLTTSSNQETTPSITPTPSGFSFGQQKDAFSTGGSSISGVTTTSSVNTNSSTGLGNKQQPASIGSFDSQAFKAPTTTANTTNPVQPTISTNLFGNSNLSTSPSPIGTGTGTALFGPQTSNITSTTTSTVSSFGIPSNTITTSAGVQQPTIPTLSSSVFETPKQPTTSSFGASGGFGSLQPSVTSSGGFSFKQPTTGALPSTTSSPGTFGSTTQTTQPAPFQFGSSNTTSTLPTTSTSSNSASPFQFGQTAQQPQTQVTSSGGFNFGSTSTTSSPSAASPLFKPQSNPISLGAGDSKFGSSTFGTPASNDSTTKGFQFGSVTSGDPGKPASTFSGFGSTSSGSTGFTMGNSNTNLTGGKVGATDTQSQLFTFGGVGQTKPTATIDPSASNPVLNTTSASSGFTFGAGDQKQTWSTGGSGGGIVASLASTTSTTSSFGFGNQLNSSSTMGTGTTVFGSQNLSNPSGNTNVFGAQNSLNSNVSSTPNLFGSPQMNATPKSAIGTGLFGAPAINTATTAPSMFGASGGTTTPTIFGSTNTATATPTVFGSPSSSLSSGVFGGQQQNAPTFGSPTVFGTPQQQSTASFSSGTFGSPQQSITGTTSPSGFTFNQQQPSSGSSTSSSGAFGFGAQQSPQQTPFQFGSSNNTTLPNMANNNSPFQFGQPAQPQNQGGFNFGGSNPTAMTPTPGANPMFTLGSNTTPRRRDNLRARRYR